MLTNEDHKTGDEEANPDTGDYGHILKHKDDRNISLEVFAIIIDTE